MVDLRSSNNNLSVYLLASFVTDNGKANEDSQEESDPDQPVFSLITGTYRHAKRYGGGTTFPYA